MELRKKYKDINETMYYIGEQVKDSLNYADKVVPDFNNPRQLFNFLKGNTTFQNDPKNVELLQTMPTLFRDHWSRDNIYFAPGHGDCDCFTIAVIAAMYAQGWKDMFIVLAGRDRSMPVHIYPGIMWKGAPYYLDLTQPYADTERQYPYKQTLRW